MKIRVSLCMIVRNEESNLAGCLEGFSKLVDEVVVVDTGSNDGTRDLARRLGAKVYDFPWCDDFSAARNESCRHATGEWILWMDADDRIDAANRQRLGKVLEGLQHTKASEPQVFCMSCACPGLESQSEFYVSQSRLFRNTPELAWRGRIHERIMPVDPAVSVAVRSTDVVIRHRGYDDPGQVARKTARNARLIEQDYVVDPDDGVTLFYMARIRLRQGRPAECLRFARRSIEREHNSSTTPLCYVMASQSLLKLGRTQEALCMTREAITQFPTDLNVLYQGGCALRDMNHLDDAVTCFRKAVELPAPKFSFGPTDPDLQHSKAHLMLGSIYQEQGKISAAEREYEQAVAAQPEGTEGLFLLGQIKLYLGRLAEARQIVARLDAVPGGEFEYAMLRGLECVTGERFDEGRKWVEAAITSRPNQASPWVMLSLLLFHEGRNWERCVEVHEKVLRMDPRQTGARKRLEQLRLRRPVADAMSRYADSGAMHAVPAGVMQMANPIAAANLSFSC